MATCNVVKSMSMRLTLASFGASLPVKSSKNGFNYVIMVSNLLKTF